MSSLGCVDERGMSPADLYTEHFGETAILDAETGVCLRSL